MQTFLPYPDYAKSAQCLDRQRLGKQRVEVLQLLKTLQDGGAWSNHPAARMWRGYEVSLAAYGAIICDEWIRRGYRDTCYNKIKEFVLAFPDSSLGSPPWVGRESFHRAHQSNLVRKLPDYYRRYFPDVPNDLPYVWPV